jgi:hypothetical protein
VLRVGEFGIVLGLLFGLLPFAVGLAMRLERHGEAILGRLAVAGAVLTLMVWFADAVNSGLLVLGDRYAGLSEATIATSWDASRLLILWLFHLTNGLWVAAIGYGVLRTGILPRWIGWLGIILLVPQILAGTFLLGGGVGALHNLTGGVAEIGAFLVWIPAAAIALLRRRC